MAAVLISLLLNSLDINPEDKLFEEAGDRCPICLEDAEIHSNFLCCGKGICESCYENNQSSTSPLLKCPMCRQKFPQTDSECLMLIQQHANLGKAWAMNNLSTFYATSISERSDPSIIKNDKECFRLLHLAAKQGYRTSQYNLAKMYWEAKGVSKYKTCNLLVYYCC